MKLYCAPLTLGIGVLLLSRPIAHADFVYVSNGANGTIDRYDSTGNETTFATGLNSPAGLAFDASGYLYVASYGDGTILRYDPSGVGSVFATGLNSPTALAIDPIGNLYVYALGDGTIMKINSGGSQSVFATGQGGFTSFLTTDNSGNVYANTAHEILQFDPSGSGSVFSGTTGIEQGIAFDSAGNMYVASQNSAYISRILGSGGPDTDPTKYPPPYDYDVSVDPGSRGRDNNPYALAFGSSGNLYATFGNLNSTTNFDFVTGVLMRFGTDGTDTILATDIGGKYIAVQPVPEPKVWTMAILGILALFIHRRSQRRIFARACFLATNPRMRGAQYSVFLLLLLSVEIAGAQPLNIQVYDAQYTTYIDAADTTLGLPTTNYLSRMTVSSSPISDEFDVPYDVPPLVTNQSIASAGLFEVSDHTGWGFANASATSEIWFSPITDQTQTVGVHILAQGSFGPSFTGGQLSLLDLTSASEMWDYSWGQSFRDPGNVPWNHNSFDGIADFDLDTAFLASHKYLLTFMTFSQAGDDAETVSIRLDGLQVVPEPSAWALLSLGSSVLLASRYRRNRLSRSGCEWKSGGPGR